MERVWNVGRAGKKGNSARVTILTPGAPDRSLDPGLYNQVLHGAKDNMKQDTVTAEPAAGADERETVLTISHLSKTYAGGFQALKDINLDIRKG
ncbi:MAG TPA: hypothetical protein VFA48_13160, partial [Gammaproteobacteria bacterium]|nr:hypothetical protein [Gammaproteobacteria bacterium]